MSRPPATQQIVPHFAVGEKVRIRSAQVFTHIRTPWYVMGKVGTVERVAGIFPDAEQTAYGHADARLVVLYRIQLSMRDIWEAYEGSHTDTLDVEIYEHWLEAA